MGDIPARKFLVTMPLFQIWDSAGTTLEHTLRFSERDNQPACRWMPEKVYDVEPVLLASGREVEYVRGWRMVGSVSFQVWPDGYCADKRTSDVAPQFTEYELALLMDADLHGQRIVFYPHAEQATTSFDTLRWVRIIKAEAPRGGLAQYPVEGTIEFRSVYPVTSADNLWKYYDAL